MDAEEFRHRLARLNRLPSATLVGGARPKAKSHAGHPPAALPKIWHGSKQPETSPPADGQSVSLAVSEIQTPWGPHAWIRRPVITIWPSVADHVDAWRRRTTATDLPPEVAAFREHFPLAAIFLDLETCGFAGSTIFLAGLLHFDGQQLVLSQLWARDYSEEKALLHSLWALMTGQHVLVTFNGKSFDWPQVQDRSTLHHLGQPCDGSKNNDQQPPPATAPCFMTPLSGRPRPTHFDLLHHARRRWKCHLPNCRLQTLERYICGRHRAGDIPGQDIPAAYHEYVRSRRPEAMRAVIHHNALDLITLLQLSLTFGIDTGRPQAALM